MLLLAADTSGKQGSIALAECGPEESCATIEVVPLTGGAFSAELVPRIADLLKRHGYSKSDLAAFAVVSGPGSFTGLRVGLAAIKALAEVLQKPIAAVSFLEAVACAGTARGRVLAMLDAGRGDIYVGDYELNPQIRMHSERLLSRKAFLADANGGLVITPDGDLAAMIRASAPAVQVEQINHPNSGVIARLGWQHLQRGETVRPEELEANYIRHSDAEIFSKPAS
ncbi:MAG: tRNA (adenosine(37)-N6)-threonylcarbamoyltransferase complex dimerization subunit type 1 TsaB [Terriglobales bacterium]